MASRSKRPSLFRAASLIWSFRFTSISALAVFIAACGFTPIHKFDATAPALEVATLAVEGGAISNALRRTLAQRLSLSDDADMRVNIEVSRTERKVQKTATGIALRLELRHQAIVELQRNEVIISQTFALTQFMTRGDSGADELSQMRALDDLAIRDLSAQIFDYLSTQNRRKTAQ